MKPLFALLLATPLLLATAQQSEVIFLDGEKLGLYACPLEQYEWRKPPGFTPISTGNYRGYVGTWLIEDQRLYLTGIEAELCRTGWPRRCRPTSLQALFPKLIKQGRVEATWFSGTLRVLRGKLLTYVHMGFASVFEEEIHLEVEQGRVIKRTVIDNRNKPHRHPLELSWEELQKMGPELGGRPRD